MVVKQNKGMPTRPIVAFKVNDIIKYIDLVDNLTVFIEEVV